MFYSIRGYDVNDEDPKNWIYRVGFADVGNDKLMKLKDIFRQNKVDSWMKDKIWSSRSDLHNYCQSNGISRNRK